MRRKVSLIYPKGTYKSTPFYYRGGDIYKEEEFLRDEAKHAKKDLKKAQLEFEEAQAEYNEASAELDETEEYTIQLAENLGDESLITTEHARLRQKIADLTQEIAETDQKITKIKELIAPAEFLPIINEHAAFYPDIEALSHEIRESNSITKKYKDEIALTLASDAYSFAIDTRTEFIVAEKCRNNLRSELTNKFSTIGSQKSKNKGKNATLAGEALKSDCSAITELLDELADHYMERTEGDLKLKLALLHKKLTEESLYKHIEDLHNLAQCNVDLEEVRKVIEDNNANLNFEEEEENDNEPDNFFTTSAPNASQTQSQFHSETEHDEGAPPNKNKSEQSESFVTEESSKEEIISDE